MCFKALTALSRLPIEGDVVQLEMCLRTTVASMARRQPQRLGSRRHQPQGGSMLRTRLAKRELGGLVGAVVGHGTETGMPGVSPGSQLSWHWQEPAHHRRHISIVSLSMAIVRS